MVLCYQPIAIGYNYIQQFTVERVAMSFPWEKFSILGKVLIAYWLVFSQKYHEHYVFKSCKKLITLVKCQSNNFKV